MGKTLLRIEHRARHEALRVPIALSQRAARALAGQSRPASPEVVKTLRKRFVRLLDEDLANVEAGLYPEALLRQMPLRRYLLQAPRLAFELAMVLRRMGAADPHKLPTQADPERYPEYYRRTYHWQTDGYLSARSARLYDVSVEFLFGGTADMMRRQVIAPMRRFLQDDPVARIADLACGTGPTLRQLRTALPSATLYGCDLSPYYVDEAQRQIGNDAKSQVVTADAAHTGLAEGSQDIVTSTYLFHELPKAKRDEVFEEMFRILRPGGLCVVQDSIQRNDSESMLESLEGFGSDFHEPYYDEYTQDPLEDRFTRFGFESVESRVHFVSKTVWAQKPHQPL